MLALCDLHRVEDGLLVDSVTEDVLYGLAVEPRPFLDQHSPRALL